MEIYLNSASTTKPDPHVIQDFVCSAINTWRNPSDIDSESLKVKEIITNAQKQIADSINASPEEIVFTSGGSESNNWAIKGIADTYGVEAIITTKIEHPSVYNTCKYLERKGIAVEYIPVNTYGVIDLDYLKGVIEDYKYRPILVSIMFANNEIGTIQPIKEISEIVHTHGDVFFHVDAVQAYMHTEIDVKEIGIDLMSTSFHKFNGLKGAGFLYVRQGVEITPLIHGGKQFNYMRSGTENVPMIYAMGNQVERYRKTLSRYEEFMKKNYSYLCNKLDEIGLDIKINGHPLQRLNNIISITIKDVNAQVLISLLESHGIYVSAGSACCQGKKSSRVLDAIGVKETDNTIRVSFCDDIDKESIDFFVEKLVMTVKSLKMFC